MWGPGLQGLHRMELHDQSHSFGKSFQGRVWEFQWDVQMFTLLLLAPSQFWGKNRGIKLWDVAKSDLRNVFFKYRSALVSFLLVNNRGIIRIVTVHCSHYLKKNCYYTINRGVLTLDPLALKSFWIFSEHFIKHLHIQESSKEDFLMIFSIGFRTSISL